MRGDYSEDLTPEETRDIAAWCKAKAREGANALHARAALTKPPQLTDAENAAIARKRIDRNQP